MLVLGYLTHRIVLSLSAGIVLAAIIASQFAPVASLKLMGLIVWSNASQSYNLYICCFLLILGIFVTMLQHSGGAYAYRMFAKRKIRNAKTAETASLVLSTGLFVDDYLSSLTTGSVMHPLTDTQHIPRVKLAYLVDSMSGPLTILCPFSSWVAAIIGFLRENGVNEQLGANTLILANPFAMFMQIVPYLFYSFILIASTWFLVRYRISFGIMRKFENEAIKEGLHAGDRVDHNPQHTTLLEFFLPMIVLLTSVLAGVFLNQSAATGLFLGGSTTLAICTIFFILRKRIKTIELPSIFWQGTKLMFSSVVILILAWSFGDLLREHLQTGQYLAKLMLDAVSINFLPIILFFTATLIAFTIGTAWGTAAMLFPIVIPLALTMSEAPHLPNLVQIPMLFPILGAVLSGCVAGNHISPIADTTVMSSLSTGAKIKDHVCTQIQYALPGIVLCGFAFYLSSFITPLLALAIAIAGNCGIFWLLTKQSSIVKKH